MAIKQYWASQACEVCHSRGLHIIQQCRSSMDFHLSGVKNRLLSRKELLKRENQLKSFYSNIKETELRRKEKRVMSAN